MDNTPNEAPAAPAESVATPNTNPTPAEAPAVAPSAPDMHGFTSEQLAEMRKFYDNNGGWEKVKSRISNPEPKVEQNVLNAPAPNDVPAAPQPQAQPARPKGVLSRQEIETRNYFERVSAKPEYAAISKEIAGGDVLKEMQDLGITVVYPDGAVDEERLYRFLDMKAQTVAAKQTSSMPEASAAPTVDYIQFDEKSMTMQQAVKILQQDSALRRGGKAGNPDAAKAEEFMKKMLNGQK